MAEWAMLGPTTEPDEMTNVSCLKLLLAAEEADMHTVLPETPSSGRVCPHLPCCGWGRGRGTEEAEHYEWSQIGILMARVVEIKFA